MSTFDDSALEARMARQAEFSREAGERATGCPNAEDYLGPMRRLQDEAWQRGEMRLFAWCVTRVLASLLYTLGEPTRRGLLLRWIGANCAEFAQRLAAEQELRRRAEDGARSC